MNPCTIVMYHYVRELRRSKYPEIKGLEVSLFEGQIEYMRRFYTFVSPQQVVQACLGQASLPPNAALLTFDDGYSDHYTHVFPILKRQGISGVFFPPAAAILEHRVLDVNKIHYVLASAAPTQEIIETLYAELEALRSQGHALASNEELYAQFAGQGIYDPPDVVFIKRLLQRGLAPKLRGALVDKLFRQHVTQDEAAFAKELYLSREQIQEMQAQGMVFGNHGYEHVWMDRLPPQAQRRELEKGLEFLQELGAATTNWLMCYPYGAHNESLRALCAELGCAAAFTTQVDIAKVGPEHALSLARLDTNDLPKAADAEKHPWTAKLQLPTAV